MADRRKALETGSGLTWEHWLAFLGQFTDADHTELAARATEEIREHGDSSNPEWWGQRAAIEFEHATGRRKAGEQCDGSFAVNASKTVNAEMDTVQGVVAALIGKAGSVAGVEITGEPRSTSTSAWRYVKVDLADGSRISINVKDEAAGKATVAVNHDKRSRNDDVADVKAWWKAFLADVAAAL